MSTPAKIQLRGICQCCGREQAVLRGYMAKHGYTVKDGWFSGICTGQHFAPMQISREQADNIAAQVRKECVELRALVADLTSGKKHPTLAKSGEWKLERHPKGYMERVDVMVPFKDAPARHQTEAREAAIWKTTRRAEMGESFANDLQARADKYHGADLREVRAADGPEPIAVGEQRTLSSGNVATVERVDGARVYWNTDPYGNGTLRRGWTGSRAWRQLPKVEYTTEENA